jgi:nucleoside-diphosphate-sugar epimerase
MKKIFITGGSGLIGTILNNHLSKNYQIVNLDISKSKNNLSETIIGDMNVYEDVLEGSKGCSVIIHLGAVISVDSSWDLVLKNNIESTRNVYEAAKINNIEKVIFASSNHAVGLFENDEPYRQIVNGNYKNIDPNKIPLIDHNVPIRPDSYYGISKAYGETIGRYYFEKHDIQSVNLRIGTVQKTDTPKSSVRHFATWLSHPDIAQLVEKSIIKEVKFEIFYGVSNNKWRFWDIKNAYNKIGYEPVENAENYRK